MSKQMWSEINQLDCPDSVFSGEGSMMLRSGVGSILTDEKGQEYIDLSAGFGALPLGHCHSSLMEIMKRFAENPTLVHGLGDVYPSEDKARLLSAMSKFLPESWRVGLALTGGQAVEFALKTSFLATKRHGVIVCHGGYHGLDLGILPLLERPSFCEPFRGWNKNSHENVVHVNYGASDKEFFAAAARLKNSGNLPAAIIVEPIQGRGGVNIPPLNWLKSLRSICDELGCLLISDEIFTGLGRIGQILSGPSFGADLVCIGKALGGGFPLSACVGKNEVMTAWPENKGEAIHTGTFFGHPFTCAVADKTLEKIFELKLAKRSKSLGKQGLLFLKTKISGHSQVKEIRGEGLMIGIECFSPGFGETLMKDLRNKGVIAIPSGPEGRCLSISPALNIPEELLFSGLSRVVECFLEKTPI